MKKETFYFSHDYTTRNDEKIKNLMYQFGPEGYGIYWILIEELYQNANTLQTNYKRMAFDMRVDEVKIKSIIEDFGLFTVKNNLFSSTSVQRRLDLRDEKSNKARDSAQRRWNPDANASKKHANATEINANAMREECERNAIKESKVKESKLKEKFTSDEETFLPVDNFDPLLKHIKIIKDTN